MLFHESPSAALYSVTVEVSAMLFKTLSPHWDCIGHSSLSPWLKMSMMSREKMGVSNCEVQVTVICWKQENKALGSRLRVALCTGLESNIYAPARLRNISSVHMQKKTLNTQRNTTIMCSVSSRLLMIKNSMCTLCNKSLVQLFELDLIVLHIQFNKCCFVIILEIIY